MEQLLKREARVMDPMNPSIKVRGIWTSCGHCRAPWTGYQRCPGEWVACEGHSGHPVGGQLCPIMTGHFT